MDAKIKKCCPKCCQYYRLKLSGSKHEDGNIPLFLSCGHTMCENCIRTITKCEEFIECPICGQDIHFSASGQAVMGLDKFSLYELFPVNINMLGELMLQHIGPKNEKDSCDDDYFLNITELIKSTESSEGKCVECHESTSKMCKQCGIIVCKNCFNKSHKNFIIFKNHALQNIELQSENTLCITHKSKSLDYYCTNCAKAICMDCFMVGGEKSCKNHNVTSIQEVNEGMLAELVEITPKVDETFRRLTKTAVDIGHTLMRLSDENSSSTLTKILNEVEQHYSKLNAAIQNQKKEIIDSIMNLKSTEIESLNEAKYSIAESIQKAKQTLNNINSIDPNKLRDINMSAVLKDAKEVVNIPWYLNQDRSDTRLKLKINKDIFSIINNYVQLDGKENTTYSLCTTQALNDRHEDIPAAPSAVVHPPEVVKDVRQLNKTKTEKLKENIKPTSFIKKVPQYRSKTGSLSSLNSTASDTSNKSYQSYNQQSIVTPFPESQHPKQILEGSQEVIYISHIVDPHNFYVQRACHQSNVKELLREFRNAVSMPKPSVNHVAEGKVYLVLNKADNLWQRCRVMTIDRRNLNKPLYRVFCVDFGSTELVTIDKLRLLPPARIQSPPPFAINCCLANCEPINGAWTSDDSILIQNIIDNKQAVLHVRRVRSSAAGAVTLECDVSTVEHGLSVAHALAFHGRARVSNTVKYPNMIGIVEKQKLFINNNDFKLNAVEEVYITHIVSPDHFYVRKEHLQSVYEKLCEDLDQEYSSNSNDLIYLPEKDMSCVARCGVWSRAVVRAVCGRGRVRALLVDTGETRLLHWSALRPLSKRHATLRALATECHLAGVTPLNKKWSPGSVALLQKFEDKLLELHVEDDRNKNSLGVTLYDKSDEDDVICVNTQMIKYKFAVTFGLFMFNKNTEMDDLVITNKSPLDEPKPAIKSKVAVTILKREEVETQKPKEEDLEAKDKGPLRLEAKVLNYQSPSLLYVSLVHQQKLFNELFEKMQKYYSKKKPQGKHVWNVGDRCCTLCCQSQTWRRAAILEVNEGDAKVFYSDFACVETIPLANLRELTQEFASIGDAAIMCHLCGVIPAVGEEWPSLTKEYLNELLDAYKRVFITKFGKFKGKSMPVELWVYHIIQGGALEPNTSEWRCLNKKIIEQGLGIPDKREESTSESTSTGDDMLSFFNITGSVRDWLQIEPMPLKPLQIKSDSDSRSWSSTPGETDGDKAEEDIQNSNTVFISDWLPPEPLPTTEFTAMPTYTDNDGVVYLHNIAQQDTLDLIRKALDVRFKTPDPKAKFYKWSVGEPCIALYFLDNCFYRGKILAVNNDESNCLVHYIDYGNDDICAFKNLRKSIALYQIPTQAHKCILDRIQPIGKKWDRTTLDYIHKSIVEKQCFVKVTGEMIGDMIPIELKYDKLWINDHLVEFEMARYSDGSEAVIRKYAPNIDINKKLERTIDTDSGPDYIVEDDPTDTSISQDSVPVSSPEGKDWNDLIDEEHYIDGKFTTYKPYNKTEFLCTITVLNELNKLELNIVHNEEMTKMYEDMYEELQTDSSDMVDLNGIFENKACVALFPEDGKWYRASILEYSKTSNRIKVKYIDYGNIKVLSLFNVKEITDKYIKLEPANVTATLYGVTLNPDIDKVTVSERYEHIFLDKEPFEAKVIKSKGSIPSVELRQNGKLIYEDLILENLFLRSN